MKVAAKQFVDRLSCEFHSQIIAYFMDRDILMFPRFRSEREDWVQHILESGQAVCIMSERSSTVAGLDARPLQRWISAAKSSWLPCLGMAHRQSDVRCLGMAAAYQW